MSNEGHPAPPGAKQAIVTVIILVPLVAAYMFLGMAIGVTALWAGFLFLLYWGAVHALSWKTFAGDLVGGLGGVLYAYLCHLLPTYGLPGGLLLIAILCVTTYFLIRQQLSIFANLSLMLFLTVCTIPMVAEKADYVIISIGVVYGAAFGAAVTFIVGQLTALAAKRAAN